MVKKIKSQRQSNLRLCQGIIVNPMHKHISTPLVYIHKYGALRLSTSYCFQNIGPYPHLYYRTCNNQGNTRSKKTEKGKRYDSCKVILKYSMNNTTKKVVHKQGYIYHRAKIIPCSPILTNSDAILIINFIKTCLTDLKKTGQLLRLCLVNSLDF